jgi:hypothetical protein
VAWRWPASRGAARERGPLPVTADSQAATAVLVEFVRRWWASATMPACTRAITTSKATMARISVTVISFRVEVPSQVGGSGLTPAEALVGEI